MLKSSKTLKLTLISALTLGISLSTALAANSNVEKDYVNRALKGIESLNANFNAFKQSKDYENFIESRSKLLKRTKNNALRDVDVLAQPKSENMVFISKFKIVPDDGYSNRLVRELEKEANKYAGNEFDARRIAALKNNLTNIVLRNGYATSVVYFKNGNFDKDTKELTFSLLWGKVNEIKVHRDENPDAFKNKAMLLTMPGFSNNILKIEGIDQVVENGTTPNKQVRVDVAAALNKTGYSDIILHPYRTKMPKFGLSFNNANSKGQVGDSFTMTAGDVIGINDTWTFIYGGRVPNKGRYFHNIGLKYSQPIGWFDLELDAKRLLFKNTSSGVNNTKYKVYNPSTSLSGKLSYKLYRSQYAILNAYSDFSYSFGKTDVRLEEADKSISYSDNRSTTLKVGVNYLNNALGGGRFYTDLYLRKDLSLFGGAATAGFDSRNNSNVYGSSINLYANYSKSFYFLTKTWTSSATFNGQVALTDRYSAGSATFGDAYSIRGLREETITGDNGFNISTNVGPIFNFDNRVVSTVNPFMGLDFGYVNSPAYKGGIQDLVEENYYAASFATGLKVYGSYYNTSFTLGVPFATKLAKHFKDPYPIQMYWSFGLNY